MADHQAHAGPEAHACLEAAGPEAAGPEVDGLESTGLEAAGPEPHTGPKAHAGPGVHVRRCVTVRRSSLMTWTRPIGAREQVPEDSEPFTRSCE